MATGTKGFFTVCCEAASSSNLSLEITYRGEPSLTLSPAQLEMLCAMEHLPSGPAPVAAESLQEPAHVVGG